MAHYSVEKYLRFLNKYRVELSALRDTLQTLNVPVEIRKEIEEKYRAMRQKEEP